MLRLLIRDITVEELSGQRQFVLHVRWQGGVYTDVTVNLPRPRPEAIRYPAETVEQVRQAERSMSDPKIVARFNQAGLRSPYASPLRSR